MSKYIFLIFISLTVFISCNNSTEIKIDENQITKFKNDTGLVLQLTQEIIKDSHNAKLFKKRAVALFEKKQVADAISDLEMAILLDSTNTEYLNLISDYWIINGNSKPTKEYLDKSLKINPNNAETLTRMAKLYLYVQDHIKSFEYANNAIKISPSLYTPYFVKGICYTEMGDSIRAIKELQKAVSLNPDFYDGYQFLGVVCTKSKDSLAISYFRIAQKLKPQSIEARYALGYYYQDNDDYDKAIIEYKYIINNVDSTYSDAYYNIGYIKLVYLEDYQEATDYFSLAKKYNPNNPDIHYNLGFANEKLGNKTEAKNEYEIALKLDPDHELSKNGINRINNLDASGRGII
jgi:tetratricopeptide (TPR) repeat protein